MLAAPSVKPVAAGAGGLKKLLACLRCEEQGNSSEQKEEP
jgi:hypothetical protein